jgi:hypothetical protein
MLSIAGTGAISNLPVLMEYEYVDCTSQERNFECDLVPGTTGPYQAPFGYGERSLGERSRLGAGIGYRDVKCPGAGCGLSKRRWRHHVQRKRSGPQ